MRIARSTVLGIVGFVVLAGADRAAALTVVSVDQCLASQLRIVAKATTAYASCHAKAAADAVPTDSQCLGKATLELTSALAKLEGKKTCQLEGAAAALAGDASDYAASLDATVGHAFKCDGKKMRTTAKLVAALMGCYAKAAGKTGTVDGRCVAKATAAFGRSIPKEEIGIAYCSALFQIGVLGDAARAFVEEETCKVDVGNPLCNGIETPTPTRTATPGGPTATPTPAVSPTPTVTATPICNDGSSSPGEPCDPTAPSSGWGACRADQICTDCTCACPSSMVLTTEAADPASVLDLGWTGIQHRQPMASDGTITVQLDCPAASHPCGTCTVSGPIANPQAGAGELDNRRCTTNPAKHCAADATCAARTCLGGANDGGSCAADTECPSGTCPPVGACAYYASAPFPMGAGGVAMCLVQRIVGSVGGTADVESGAAAIATMLESRVHSPIGIDAPCPRCSDAGGLNDGVAGGTCDGGPRHGLACDANAIVPGRPDYGRTSLDCPPLPAGLLADPVLPFGNATDAVTRALSTASPSCTASGFGTAKCLCDTCNDANAEPCFTNTDCPPSGGNPGVCGGRRCLAGPNLGAPCTASSQCPSSTCARPGTQTAPTGCIEDYTQDGMVACVAQNGTDEGECVVGPTDQVCSLASGHGQRGCTTDGDCGGATGACESNARKCFLTGAGTFSQYPWQPGTDTLVAAGMASPPVGGVAHPTLASVLCVPPVGSVPMNTVAGLPGPARLTVKTTVRLQP